jgi:predicted permease
MSRTSHPRWSTLDRVRTDVLYACRGLRQSPAFAAAAILSLALGIGAATAVVTQVNAVFFQAPPVADPSALRTVAWTSPQRAFAEGLFRGPMWDARPIGGFPHAIFEQIRDRVAAFSEVACWRSATESLDARGLVRVQAVSGAYFRTLGVTARSGRTLGEGDDRIGAPLVALVREASLLDKTIRIHGHVFNVVGVLPRDFHGLAPLEPADVFVSYAADALFPTFQRNSWAQCQVVARVKPGTAAEQARAETELLVQQFIAANPPKEAYQPPRLHLEDLSAQSADLQQRIATPLQLTGTTVGILLLITCANIGGLLFARGRARRNELATRLALGGARRRLVQQLFTESLVLCVAGGALGVLVAFALTPLLPRLLQELAGTTAIGLALRPETGVLLVASGITVFCGILFGLAPALAVARLDPMAALRQAVGIAPPARLRAGKAALAIQLTLAMAVLGGAGLLVRTMINLRAVPLGYEPEGLAFVETNNPVGRPRAFVEETLAQLRNVPGVATATVSQWPIFNNTVLRAQFCIPGADPQQQRLDLSFVFPGFFDVWGVRIVQGRDIDDGPQQGAIVNETFVKRFLGGKPPLGHVIGSGGDCPGRTQLPIVGVVADHIDRQRVELMPAVYLRYPRAGALYSTTYAIRTNGDVGAILPAFRRVIADRIIAPNRDVTTGVDYRDSVIRRERLLTSLLVFFAGAGLLIAAIGVYGMLAYAVSWRTSEIGVRMAVGATRLDVTWMVARESLLPVVFGIVAGAGSALLLGRALQSTLFGVSTTDPVSAAVAALLILLTATLAAVVPARRACRVDPLSALRCE